MSFATLAPPVAAATIGYLIGSIPWAYIIVRLVVHEDITEHGTGNVGAMNVRRSTGSWGWFVVAMLADGIVKGFLPVASAKLIAGGIDLGSLLAPVGRLMLDNPTYALVPQAALAGAVLGHNYSLWMAFIKRQFSRTGKGLATGGGALLAYDWRYFVAVVAVGLAVIALSKYMLAGQVAAAFTLPVAAFVLQSPDWMFALIMGIVVYAAHHRRFMGMLQGKEPRFYINDQMGPRG